MNISDLGNEFGFEALCREENDAVVTGGYTSDLLSDVMSKGADSTVLITIQAHKNTVAVASLIGIKAVIICNDRPVPDDMLAAAKEEHIAVYRTSKTQFEVSGLVYGKLKK